MRTYWVKNGKRIAVKKVKKHIKERTFNVDILDGETQDNCPYEPKRHFHVAVDDF